jgi:hypothetical protein
VIVNVYIKEEEEEGLSDMATPGIQALQLGCQLTVGPLFQDQPCRRAFFPYTNPATAHGKCVVLHHLHFCKGLQRGAGREGGTTCFTTLERKFGTFFVAFWSSENIYTYIAFSKCMCAMNDQYQVE